MSGDKYKEEEHVKKFVQDQEKDKIEKEKLDKVLGSEIQDTSEIRKPWEKKQMEGANEIGAQKIKMEDLPTRGLFYPEESEIIIRAATAGEIRHWSTLDEKDLSSLDDMLNYVLERCVSLKTPEGIHSSWKDIKEVDRFYIILAVHEYTFIKGENNLQVKISETKKMDIKKEMVDYISLDERIMKHYDPERRCFHIDVKGTPPFDVTLPSVGVTNWLKNYVIRKRQLNENMEEDFISFAPFVILDWKGLGDKTYEHHVMESESWNNWKVSALSWIKDTFIDSVDPVVKYQDEQGGERQVPLNFQGGIKSLFLISNPLG